MFQGGRFSLSLELLLYIEQMTLLFNYLHHHTFQRDIRTLLFGDSQKDQAQNILLTKTVQTFIKNSRRFTEGTEINL
jgi:hypothetical protein